MFKQFLQLIIFITPLLVERFQFIETANQNFSFSPTFLEIDQIVSGFDGFNAIRISLVCFRDWFFTSAGAGFFR